MEKNQFYHIRDIKKAFDELVNSNPKKVYFTLKEISDFLVESLKGKEYNRPFVYNLEAIIRALEDYIAKNKVQWMWEFKESQVCKIIGAKKLTMHNLRTKGLISYRRYAESTIYYNLDELLDDFKEIRELKE